MHNQHLQVGGLVCVAIRVLTLVGAACPDHGPTTFVAAVTRPTNLFAAVAVKTLHDLYDYVGSTLADINGVLKVETSLTSPYLKHTRTIRTTQGVNWVRPRNAC